MCLQFCLLSLMITLILPLLIFAVPFSAYQWANRRSLFSPLHFSNNNTYGYAYLKGLSIPHRVLLDGACSSLLSGSPGWLYPPAVCGQHSSLCQGPQCLYTRLSTPFEAPRALWIQGITLKTPVLSTPGALPGFAHQPGWALSLLRLPEGHCQGFSFHNAKSYAQLSWTDKLLPPVHTLLFTPWQNAQTTPSKGQPHTIEWTKEEMLHSFCYLK